MDKIELHSGGFPLTTKTFDFLQQAYSKAIKALCSLGGQTYILEGVERSGNRITDGAIVYRGEYLPFVGGVFSNTVSLFEQPERVPYNQDSDNDGTLDLKRAYVTRYAECRTGGLESFDFNLLKRFTPLTQMSMPIGAIVMWSGSIADIPKGWALCDGSHSTPDLRNRFVVGVGDRYGIGSQGGLDSVALTTAQLPAHSHTANASVAGRHSHYANTDNDGEHLHSLSVKRGVMYSSHRDESDAGGSGQGHRRTMQSERDTSARTGSSGGHRHTVNVASAGNHSHNVTVGSTGGSQAHENRPPYYAMAFIIFKGL